MKTKNIFLLTFLLVSCLASAQSYIPLQQHMQGVSGAEKITNLAEVEADLGRFTNLSATTGILSTANAQTLNVTGNATVNGFNYTASPTLNGASSTESTSTSVVGGIYNGDFSEGEGSTTSTVEGSMLGNTKLRAFISGTGTASITNETLKLSITSTASTDKVCISHNNDAWSGVILQKISPSTQYKFSARYKIESASTTDPVNDVGLYVLLYRQNVSGASTGNTVLINKLKTVCDWTYVETIFTSGSTDYQYYPYVMWADQTGTAYIDDIKLERVTTHTNNSTTPTVAYPVITGVSSEFVDQQQTTGGVSTGFGTNGGLSYWISQTFTPTKSKLSAISLQKRGNTGTPTGNIILELRNPSDAIIASVDITKSVWDSYATDSIITTPIFAIVDKSVTGYYFVLRSDITELNGNYYNVGRIADNLYTGGNYRYSSNSGSSWTTITEDLYFKTHYAENTRQITLTNSSTGTSTTVDWGDDGLPDGAVVDLYNGTMSWDSSFSTSDTTLSKAFSCLYYADYGNALAAKCVFNSWKTWSNAITASGSKYLYFKIPAKYIKDATLYAKASGSNLSVSYSFDSSNWVKIIDVVLTSTATYSAGIRINNNKEMYLKVGSTSASTTYLSYLGFTATLDTSAIAPLLLVAGSNTINQSVNGGSYKANVAIKSVSGGFQTTLNEANKQLTVLRNAPRSYLETPDKTTNAIVVDNDELVSISGPVQVNGATIMNASTTPAYDIALPYNSGGAIGSSWNTYSETKYKNIISDVTEASYANIASRLAGVQSKMVTRKIPDAVKATFFDAEIEWVTDVVSVTEELKTQVVEPVYEVVKMDSKVTLDSKATKDQLLTAEASPKIVSYATKEVSVLRSPGEYPRQEFRGWKVRAGVDEATKKQLENLYLKPHPEPIADTAPEAYRVPEGFAWSKWIEESTLYHNWILPQIINEIPQLRKRLEALESSR